MTNQYQINSEQLNQINELVKELNKEQLVWLNGYISGLINGNTSSANTLARATPKSSEKISILYGTHTGHSKEIALDLYDRLSSLGFSPSLKALDEYKKTDLKKEQYLFLTVSTHGEGEPPIQAEDFHEYVLGKRAPKLEGTKFSVLALGDKSYKKFCQTGVDFNEAFKKLGAEEIVPIHKADVAYEEIANSWIDSVASELQKIQPAANSTVSVENTAAKKKKFNRTNPFYAEVLEKVRITTEQSEKEIYHVEISLEDSDIEYQAGDSIGVLPNNPVDLVDLIINHFAEDPERIVRVGGKDVSLFRALQHKLEITVLNREVLEKYNEIVKNKELATLLKNEEALDQYLYGADTIDLLEDFPGEIKADEFIGILRVLYARLYSISSGPTQNPEEVHITVASLRYKHKKRNRNGACSTYISDQINVGDHIPVFIEKNEAFRLPKETDKPLIMVGAGTGVAPYRSFLQEIEQNNKQTNSWLFFGNQRFKEDFLYQVEWQKYLQKGVLNKLDVAFSRDQNEKEYVQHKLKQKASEVFQWLENGAHFYICGDKNYMAKDVQESLKEIITSEGGITAEKAEEYLKKLKKERRLLLDVY